MNKMFKKLKQKKGETLIEAMVSMLIALLSMAFLCSCILVATNTNVANKQADERYREQLKKAESMQAPNVEECNDPANAITISFQKNDVEVEQKTVQNVGAMEALDYTLIFYAGEENDLFISYDYIP